MITNPQFFIGVVEDINDPASLNRVKVRIFGKHSTLKNDMPTENLPWYTSVMPMTNAGISGIGKTVGVLRGSWVFGVFIDGSNEQEALILGTVSGESNAVNNANPQEGFSDPQAVYPRVSGADTPVQTESDLQNKRVANRTTDIPIARKTTLKTLLPSETSPEEESISTPDPNEYSNPQYPYNNVEIFSSGHAIEYDSTPGYERISQTHSSGTTSDITANGDKIQTIVGDGYTVYNKNNTVYIVGNCNITANGDINVKCEGNYVLDIDGDLHYKVGGNIRTQCNGNTQTEILGKREINIGSTDLLKVKDSQTIEVGDDMLLTVKNDLGQTINGKSEIAHLGDTNINYGTTLDTTVNSNHTDMVMGSKTITSVSNMKLNCTEKIHINTPIQRNSGDVIAGGGGVSLITHLHTQKNGNDNGGGADTTASIAGTGAGS